MHDSAHDDRRSSRCQARHTGTSRASIARLLTAGPAAMLIIALTATPAVAQIPETVAFERQKLSDSVYFLSSGWGGNLAASVGEDGIFLVDDQFAPLTDEISASLAEVSDQPLRFVINTHWHHDHTGGNENFGSSGSLIIAHDNVRRRMSTEQVSEFLGRTTPPSPEVALPIITFSDTTTLHLNGEAIAAYHSPHGHTDGDAIIHFRDSNVIHMGDTYFNGMFPFIDLDSGGNANGVIAAVDLALGMADANTRIIPGHGPLASRDDLQAYRDFLARIRDEVRRRMDDGQSLEAIIEADLVAAETEQWGADGFIKPDQFVTFVYRSLEE